MLTLIIPLESTPYIIRFYSVDARQEIGLAKFDYCEGYVQCETLPSECVDKLAEKINRVEVGVSLALLTTSRARTQ